MAGKKIKKIVPKGFITGEVKSRESLKAAKAAATKETGIARGVRPERGGTSRKRKDLTLTEKRDLSYLKQTYLLDNVEELILDQQKKYMAEADKTVREAIIPYTPSAHQLEVHQMLEQKRFGVVVFHRGAGKKLCVKTPVPRIASARDPKAVPQFVPLSAIEKGDTICGLNGPTTVLDVHPITYETIYEVKTKTGAVIHACKDHLWKVARVRKNNDIARSKIFGHHFEVVQTSTLKRWMKDPTLTLILPKPDPVPFPHNDSLPISPYLYGLWIGSRKCNLKSFHIAIYNKQLLEPIVSEFNALGVAHEVFSTRSGTIIVKPTHPDNYFDSILNLIPKTTLSPSFLFSSVEQRIALLHGIMDQRGIVIRQHSPRHTANREAVISSNQQLASSVASLLSSLGVTPTQHTRFSKKDKNPWFYVIFKSTHFNPFLLSPLHSSVSPTNNCLIHNYNVIKSVTRKRSTSPMRCLTVSDPNGLFLVSPYFVPTHNTWLAINELIKRAWSCPLPQGGKFIYIAPEKLQAKKIAWRELKFFLKNVPHQANETNLIITLPNNSTIELEGADNPDRIRGQHPHFVVMDEVAQMPRDTWYEAVFPALRAHNGGALFIGTPKGDNLFKDLFDQAPSKTSWFAISKTIYDTNVATLEQINEIKSSMPLNKFQQEYLCSFQASVQGTYFADILNSTPNIITNVPFDPALPVITGWDLGTSDATSIWFVQLAPGSNHLRFIDFEEYNQKDVHFYINLVKSKPYSYDYHVLPHDVNHVSWEANRSRIQIFRQHHMPVHVARKLPIPEGISIAQTALYTSQFDQFKCQNGINHLLNYRSKQCRTTGLFLPDPLHDQHSNAADALRTLTVGIRNHVQHHQSNYPQLANSSYDWLNPEGDSNDKDSNWLI